MRTMLLPAIALLAGAAPAAALEVDPAPCPTERAQYRMETGEEGDFRVAFVPARHGVSAASDLYLKLTTPQRDYWFGFAASNGYGSIALLPVSDPYAATAEESGPRDLLAGGDDGADGGDGAGDELLASLRFFAMDAALRVAESPPQKGEEAPPYLMMPDIGLALWYDVRSLSADDGATADSMPRGVFKRTGCLAKAPPEAFP